MKPALFALLTIVGAAPALAETPDERSACTPDVLRLCAAQIPNAGAITACLRERRVSLSTACRVVMDQKGGSVRSVATRR
ncbi:hypothetical protein ACLBX9_24180 [Methylobacterium sp. A49B]